MTTVGRALAASMLCAGFLGVQGCATAPAGSPWQVRTDDTMHAVQRGMSRDDLMHLVGPPDETMKFPSGKESWDYLYQDTWGFRTRFSATFGLEGEVVDTVAVRLNDGGRSGRR